MIFGGTALAILFVILLLRWSKCSGRVDWGDEGE